MAASKTEVPISKLVDKMETKLQRLCICFRGPATQWDYQKMLYHQAGSEKSNMAAFKSEVPISKLVDKIETLY